MKTKKHFWNNAPVDTAFHLMNYFILIVILLVCAYPLLVIISSSVSDADYVNRGLVTFLPKGFQVKAFELVLRDSRLLSGSLNTIFYATVGTLLRVTVTVMAGFALSRRDMFGHKWIIWFFLVPMYISGGLIPTYIQATSLHLTGTRAAIIIMGCVSIWNLIVCRTFFQNSIPNELWEAASIDGCSLYRFFVSVVVPNSSAIIAIMVLYYAVDLWNDYFSALIYLQDSSQYPLQLVMRNILLSSQMMSATPQSAMDPTAMAELTKQADSMKYALIIISSLPVLILYPFVQKFFVKGVMIGSVKG